MDGIDCSADSSIATMVFTLRGNNAMILRDQVYSALQNGSATIEYSGTSYTLVCIVSTFCPEATVVDATMAKADTTSERYTTEIVLGISAILIGLVLSVTVTVIIWYLKHRKKSSLNLTIDDLHSHDSQGHHCISNTYNSAVSCENYDPTSIRRMSNEQLHPQIPSRHSPASSTNCHPANRSSENQSRPVYIPFDTRQTSYGSYNRSYDANVLPQVQNRSNVMPHFFSSNFTTDV